MTIREALNENPSVRRGHWPRVAIIILNWNGWRDTLECLEAVLALDYPNFLAIVVDNHSTDDSVAKIRSWARGEIPVRTRYVESFAALKPVEIVESDPSGDLIGGEGETQAGDHDVPSFRRILLIPSDKNLGFAGGNNVAIRYALEMRYEYIWLLNNDAVPDREALTQLMISAESDSRNGMVGSKILDYEEPETIQSIGENLVLSRMRGKWPARKWPLSDPSGKVSQPLWMWAASLLISRECLEEIRGFDERYFFSYEDIDLCIRARKRQWRLSCCMDSRVWHKGSLKDAAAFKTLLGRRIQLNSFSRFKLRGYYQIRNEIFFIKNFFPHLLVLSLLLDVGLLLKSLVLEDCKYGRARVIREACWDGLTNRMGEKRHG
jgi:hypothetical protein